MITLKQQDQFAHEAADKWNAEFKTGQLVEVKNNDGSKFIARTQSIAFVEAHDALVLLQGTQGHQTCYSPSYYPLRRITAIKQQEKQ